MVVIAVRLFNTHKMISNNPTPVNEFSPAFAAELDAVIVRAARETSGRKIAAFDADGTLWDTDAGENFFEYQIHNCGLSLPADPWKHYLDQKAIDPRIAYLWLAAISKGHSIEKVRKWAAEAVAKLNPYPVLKSQADVIRKLQGLGFEVYIITASVKWAVEPSAALLGIDRDHVLGVETKVVNGLVTDTPVYPVTWREGKAEALLKATGGVRPVYASGNTDGDLMLLELATIPVAVSTQNTPGKLNDSEKKLRDEAKKRGWRIHEFRPPIS
jgi:phosphoserine phosphatase